MDGLEAQCALIEELRYQIREAWPAPWSVEMFPLSEKAVAGFAAFIRTRDRELVEKLEGLAAKWDKENSLRSDDSYRYPQQLRAVLAARERAHEADVIKWADIVQGQAERDRELVEKLEGLAAKWEYYVPGVGGTGDCVSELRAVLGESRAERERWEVSIDHPFVSDIRRSNVYRADWQLVTKIAERQDGPRKQ